MRQRAVESSCAETELCAVLGAGSWGTALALILAQAGRTVRLWGRDEELIAHIAAARQNERYLPGVALPEAVELTHSIDQALEGAGAAILAVPSSAMREVAAAARDRISASTLLVSAAKGLEEESGLRMTQVLEQEMPGALSHAVALSGPNLAVELARGVPTACVAASPAPQAAAAVQSLFAGQAPVPALRVYTGTDVVGVELGGAVKNVIAIGAGVSDALGYGDNAKAALLTRGLSETIRLGMAEGALQATFAGLSGVGDLFVTAASRLSRNYRVGYGLGQGRALADVMTEIDQVAEGVSTTRVLCDLARRRGVEMPLCQALAEMLFAGRSAPDVIRGLLTRPVGEE